MSTIDVAAVRLACGMAILPQWDPAAGDIAAARGYGFTVLSQSYEHYDRQLFEDTLNDWQWTGKGEPRPWYRTLE